VVYIQVKYERLVECKTRDLSERSILPDSISLLVWLLAQAHALTPFVTCLLNHDWDREDILHHNKDT